MVPAIGSLLAGSHLHGVSFGDGACHKTRIDLQMTACFLLSLVLLILSQAWSAPAQAQAAPGDERHAKPAWPA